MCYYIDVLIFSGLLYAIWRGLKKGYLSNWLKFGYNILGFGIAALYASKLSTIKYFAYLREDLYRAVSKSNLQIDISVSSGSRFPHTNLPEQLNTILEEHVKLLNTQQEALMTISEKIVVNILGGLACYLLIWLAIRIVFFVANGIIIKGNTYEYSGHAFAGILPAVGNAFLCAILLSGVLWPFVILFDHIGLAYVWESSRLLRFLADMFYYIQVNWII